MAEKQEPKLFEEFVARKGTIEELGEVVNTATKDTRPEFRGPAFDKLRGITYDYASANHPSLVANVKREDFKDKKQISDFAGMIRTDNEEGYSGLFHRDNIGTLTNQIPTGVLEDLVLSEASSKNPLILGNMSESDIPVFQKYVTVVRLKDQKERWESRKFTSNDEEKMYVSDAIRGKGEDEVKALREKVKSGKLPQDKRSDDFIESIRPIAERAVQLGHVKEEEISRYAMAGAQLRLDKAQKEYDELVKENGGNDIFKAVRGAITKLSSAGTQEFTEMTNRLYGAYTSYQAKSKKE